MREDLAMDERGYTLQTVIITSILTLAVVGIAIVVFRILSDNSEAVKKENRPVPAPQALSVN